MVEGDDVEKMIIECGMMLFLFYVSNLFDVVISFEIFVFIEDKEGVLC